MKTPSNGYSELASAIVKVLTAKTNMEHLNRFVDYYSKVESNKLTIKERDEHQDFVRDSAVLFKDVLNAFSERLSKEYTNNNMARCEAMLESLERQLQFYYNFNLSAKVLWGHIVKNWNGTYREIKFQTNTAELQYEAETKELVVQKSSYTEDAVAYAQNEIEHSWVVAFDQMLHMKLNFQNKTMDRLTAGRKTKTPMMIEIWNKKEDMEAVLQKLFGKGLITRSELNGSHLWLGKKKELGEQYCIWNNRGYFKKEFTNPERARAILSFFNVNNKKSLEPFFL